MQRHTSTVILHFLKCPRCFQTHDVVTFKTVSGMTIANGMELTAECPNYAGPIFIGFPEIK